MGKNTQIQRVLAMGEHKLYATVLQTLYLASALIKCIWNTCAASQTSLSQQQVQQAQAQYTALQQEEELHDGIAINIVILFSRCFNSV